MCLSPHSFLLCLYSSRGLCTWQEIQRAGVEVALFAKARGLPRRMNELEQYERAVPGQGRTSHMINTLYTEHLKG
jgi:hypothetical protein